jgi:hypothetical protein
MTPFAATADVAKVPSTAGSESEPLSCKGAEIVSTLPGFNWGWKMFKLS